MNTVLAIREEKKQAKKSRPGFLISIFFKAKQ